MVHGVVPDDVVVEPQLVDCATLKLLDVGDVLRTAAKDDSVASVLEVAHVVDKNTENAHS